MEWLRENAFWVIVFILFIGMHLFGHGGHGGHGGGDGQRRGGGKEDDVTRGRSMDTDSGGHRH